MKRQDLEVGKTYRYDPSNGWASHKGHRAADAKVLDLGVWIHPERSSGYAYSSKPRPEPRLATPRDPKGKTGVLVELTEPTYIRPGETVTYTTVVPLQYLRGTVAEVDALYDKARLARQAVTARKLDRSARRQAVHASLPEIGVNQRYTLGLSDSTLIPVEMEELAAMVAALKAIGWKYERQQG